MLLGDYGLEVIMVCYNSSLYFLFFIFENLIWRIRFLERCLSEYLDF